MRAIRAIRVIVILSSLVFLALRFAHSQSSTPPTDASPSYAGNWSWESEEHSSDGDPVQFFTLNLTAADGKLSGEHCYSTSSRIDCNALERERISVTSTDVSPSKATLEVTSFRDDSKVSATITLTGDTLVWQRDNLPKDSDAYLPYQLTLHKK